MKKYLLLLILFIFINNINAFEFNFQSPCYYNGEQVPCDTNFYIIFFIIFVPIILFLIFYTIFAIKMFYDFYNKISNYPEIFNNDWLVRWIIISIITGGLALFIYYFSVYRKYNEVSLNNLKPVITNEVSANHFRKLYFPWNFIMNIFFLNFLNPYGYADGGKLEIDGSKIIFKPHVLNMPGGKFEIKLPDIKNINLSPGVNNKVLNLLIKTKNGEEKFVIWKVQSDKFLKILKK